MVDGCAPSLCLRAHNTGPASAAANLAAPAFCCCVCRQRLVWGDPAVVNDLLKTGLFMRIYEPQLMIRGFLEAERAAEKAAKASVNSSSIAAASGAAAGGAAAAGTAIGTAAAGSALAAGTGSEAPRGAAGRPRRTAVAAASWQSPGPARPGRGEPRSAMTRLATCRAAPPP